MTRRNFPNGFPSTAYKLHWKELIMAAQAGVMRRAENIYKGTEPKYGSRDVYGWSADIDGCIGEVVIARTLNRYWSPGESGRSDLEETGIEVRSSRHNDPHLIIHRNDHDEKPYALVWLHGAYGYLAGWCFGAEGKQEEYWRTDVAQAAYFVPRFRLRPWSELTRLLSEGALLESPAPRLATP